MTSKTDKKHTRKILFWYKNMYDAMLDRKGHGGAEVQLFLLAKELSHNKKNEVYAVVEDDLIKDITNRNGIKLVPMFKSTKSNPSLLKKIFQYISRKIRIIYYMLRINPDFIITMTAGKTVYNCSIISKIFNKKFIFLTAHDWDCDGTYEKNNKKKGTQYVKGLKKTDLIITQNEYQKKTLKENYGKESIILNSMYPIFPIKYSVQQKKTVIWVGRATKWKQPEIFIDLAKDNPDTTFKMICGPAKNELEFYEKIKKKTNHIKNLELIEYIPFSKINEEFLNAKIFINTSTTEGFPNTYIQSMKNKTPILALNFNPDGIITKNRCGFCSEGNISLFKKQFKLLNTNDKERKIMGENGFSYAKENYDVKKIVKIYERIFSSFEKNKIPDESII